MKTHTLKHIGLMAGLLLTLVLTTLPARAQLGSPDLNAMISLGDDFGWGAAFGWATNTNPCPGPDPNWNGVTCNLGRVSKLDLTCGAVKLNPPFGHPFYGLTSLREFSQRSCYANGIQATDFSGACGGSSFCGNGGNPGFAGFYNMPQLRLIRLDTAQTINGTLDELFRQSVTPPAQSGLNPTRFSNLTTLYLTDTKMSGTIPGGVMLFSNATGIRLNYASFSGTLPANGNASKNLWLNGNQLEGVLPDYIRNATGTVYLRYNKFDVANTPAGAIDTLDPLWRTTQTVPPTNVQVTQTGAGTATLMWTPIAYQQHGGYYEVLSSQTPGGPYTSRGTTAASGAKTATGLTVSGLPAGTNYFIVRTFTPAHTGVFPMGCSQEVDCVTENNPNDLTSANSAETSANIAPPLIVTKTADTDDNDCSASDCSLREAIAAANATSASESIEFNISSNDAGCINGVCTIKLGGSQLEIANNGKLTINGPNAGSLTISGNGTSRVFYIASGASAEISGLTITGGNGTGTTSLNRYGGGIFNDSGSTLTLTNMTVSNNSAQHSGGIHNQTGTLMLTNTTVSNNLAQVGDGGGILSVFGTIILTNSTVSNNSAQFGGGGIFKIGGILSITNSTLSGNSAVINNGGGIISNNGGSESITNSTISGNSAGNSGGGIYSFNTLTLKNTIIANSASGGDCFRSGGTVNASSSLIEDGLGCINDTNFNNKTGDPKLDGLAGNGGPTETHKLLPGSIAIDAGDNCVLTANGCGDNNHALTTDQRGVMRPLDGDNNGSAITDIGSYEAAAATAAAVSVSGRVLSPTGRGIANAVVFLTGQNGNHKTARTNSFGYYKFEEIEAGQSMIFYVYSKRYQFMTQVINIVDSLSDLDFIAQGLPSDILKIKNHK